MDCDDDIGFPATDVTLVVEDKKIHVNKAVLSQHSPVFNAMFSGSFKESSTIVITLDNKKAKDFVAFLGCFYPNMNHTLTKNNVLQVLPLAHEYQSPLVADCEEFMISMCKPETSLTVTILLDYILVAEKYDLQKFLDTAAKFCADVDFDLLNGKKFEKDNALEWGMIPVGYTSKQTETVDKNIALKYLRIDPKTRLLIAENRL
ncbi:BTB and MATH domain-containing protein 38-like [Saccostrea echinata]|uniref:BTB and MATH domain-containing protein 38-like n=1 Tax=Saccostrea echinata TaxID=191078 RepID=UPI002A806C0F|nr:BTB and MATH domain-containing protein 38-like [Saccostrea echinata]